MHTLTYLISTYSAFDFQYTAKEAASDTGHSVTSISFTRPQNKHHKKVSVVKNIIKVINLYLKKTLRVFPHMLTWKRQWTRPSPSYSLSALCNSVHADRLGGVSWTDSDLPPEFQSHTEPMLGVETFRFECGNYMLANIALAPTTTVRVSPADL